MPGRTIAIGDIHGCSLALEAILYAVQPESSDTVVTLGDYIDRGPNSRRAVAVLLELQSHCRLIPLKGNHELLMLRGLERREELPFWLHAGGLATLASYGGIDQIPPDHVEFLRSCVDYHETDTHLFVHAGCDPQLPLAEQTELHLFWNHLGWDMPQPHVSGKTVICGHTPQRGGDVLDVEHLVCIDTFCFGTGYLTALDVGSGHLWQADKFGKLRRNGTDSSP